MSGCLYGVLPVSLHPDLWCPLLRDFLNSQFWFMSRCYAGRNRRWRWRQGVDLLLTNFYILILYSKYMITYTWWNLTFLLIWNCFFLSVFLHSNLESIRCSLIRGNHSYQVVFKIPLRVPFYFLSSCSTKSISLISLLCSLFSFMGWCSKPGSLLVALLKIQK